MQAGHHGGGGGHSFNDVVGKSSRVRGGETHPLNTLNATHSAQQFSESFTVTKTNPVGVNVLAQQSNLDGALGSQGLNLSQNLAWAPVALLTAQRRHNTESTGVVAAHRDRNPTCINAFTAGR